MPMIDGQYLRGSFIRLHGAELYGVLNHGAEIGFLLIKRPVVIYFIFPMRLQATDTVLTLSKSDIIGIHGNYYY